METTYDVRLWKTEEYQRKTGTSYYVRWVVAGKSWRESFAVKALAESFRADLVSATRKGEAFSIETGRPVSMTRAKRDVSWYTFACEFVDLKWPRVAATTRRTHAEALTAVTPLLFTTERGKPDAQLIRTALRQWGFNTTNRADKSMPEEIRKALGWVEKNTRSVSALSKPDILRKVLDGLTVKLDGAPGAPSVVNRRRKILNTAVEYAVERELLAANPIPALKWSAPRKGLGVDRRSVVNPVQARTLLAGVREQGRVGNRMIAFYACLYFAALRPEEAVSLSKRNLSLPTKGWGELTLDIAEPHAGRYWTDSGDNRDRRQLKQRAPGETWIVPCPPELTALLHEHLSAFGTGADGRLFVGERNKEELPVGTINRVWRWTRAAVLTPEVAISPLARTPYDLRHAAVSTWLNGGVPATQVAEWAGHSVEILLKIYAKCLDGGASELRQRVQLALDHE